MYETDRGAGPGVPCCFLCEGFLAGTQQSHLGTEFPRSLCRILLSQYKSNIQVQNWQSKCFYTENLRTKCEDISINICTIFRNIYNSPKHQQ